MGNSGQQRTQEAHSQNCSTSGRTAPIDRDQL
eukprot:COSAG01_NODE_56879_length_315_cov_3.837963_2_plen_31_part_01